MLSRVGRYISYRELYKLDCWPFSEPEFCVMDASVSTEPRGRVYFLSHHWLAAEHPDPDGVKLGYLKKHYDDLENMRQEFKALRPEQIDRKMQLQLLERRRHVTLMPVEHFNDYPSQQFGWDWADGGSPIARRKFHQWLVESVEGVLDGYWWIDSFALPNPIHRHDCKICQERFPAILRSIPSMISQATCFLLNGNCDDSNRGWMQLEACVASASARLIQEKQHALWDIIAVQRQLMCGHYQCSDAADAWYIPRIYALQRVYADLLKASGRKGSGSRSLLIPDIYSEVEDAMGFSSSRYEEAESGVINQIQRALRILVLPRCFDLWCRYGFYVPAIGQLLSRAAMCCTSAILLSECVRRGLAIPLGVNPESVVLAAIYQCVCREHLPLREAAETIYAHWQQMTGVSLDCGPSVLSRRHNDVEHIYELFQQGALLPMIGDDYQCLMEPVPILDHEKLESQRHIVSMTGDSDKKRYCDRLATWYTEGDAVPRGRRSQ